MRVKIPRNEFDNLFNEILVGPTDLTEERRAPQEDLKRGSRDDESINARIQLAMAFFQKKEYKKTLSTLRPVEIWADHYPMMQALLGASKAIVLGEVNSGIQSCLGAVKQAFYVAELYFVLSVALLRAGHRAKAYTVVKRGLRIDPDNKPLKQLLNEMGQRKRPMLPFLARSHPANRFLGLMRSKLSIA